MDILAFKVREGCLDETMFQKPLAQIQPVIHNDTGIFHFCDKAGIVRPRRAQSRIKNQMIETDLVEATINRAINVITHLLERLAWKRKEKIAGRGEAKFVGITNDSLHSLLVAKGLPT